MLQTKKYLLKALLFVGLVFTLSTCKKYPENRLWFKNPTKIYPFVGHITKYEVNGIDSLELLNFYYKKITCPDIDIKKAYFSTTGAPSNIATTFTFPSSINGCSSNSYLNYTFSNDKKSLNIYYSPDKSLSNRNIFIEDNLKWQIIKLTKKRELKIKTILNNGNTYEIQIN